MLGLVLLPDRGEVADRLFAVPHLAADRLVAVDDLVHALLDGRKVGGRAGGLPGEVVVEAVFDGRAGGDLGAGVEFLHLPGPDVGAVVAQHLTRVGVSGRADLYRRVALDRPGEFAQDAVTIPTPHATCSPWA